MFETRRNSGNGTMYIICAATCFAAGYGFSVLSSAAVTLPLTNWTEAGAGAADAGGNFSFTNPPAPGGPVRFFGIRIP